MRGIGRFGRISVLALAVVFALWVVIGVFAFVYPADDPLEDVDAVFVLGPATYPRIAAANAIIASNGGDIPLIVSEPESTPCYDESRICVAPEPPTTAGEAVALRQQAEQLGFEHPAVVTFTPHVSRARFLFDLCYGADVAIVGVREPLSAGEIAYEFIYQTAAFAKAILAPC